MNDEIKQIVKVEVDEALRNLGLLTDAERKLGDETKEAGEKAGGASQKGKGLATTYDKALASVKGLVAGYLGVNGLIQVIRLGTEEIQKNAQASRELAQAQLDLQFLGSGNTGNDLQAVRQASEVTGRSQVEVSAAFAQLKSQTANLSDEQRLALFRELSQTSLTTSAPINELVELFSKTQRFEADPNVLQNTIAQTIIESAETSPSAIARLLPQVLPVGQATGLSTAQTSGLLSSFTGLAGSPEQGATGLRNVLLALQGRGTPESQQILQGVGAGGDQGFFDQLRVLAGALSRGEVSTADLESIAGKENVAVLSAALQDLGGVESTVGRVVAASQFGGDITADRLKNILNDPRQRLDLLTRQTESRVTNLRASDTNAQEAAALKRLLEEQGLRNGSSDVTRSIQAGIQSSLVAIGIDPETATLIAGSSAFGGRIDDEFTNAGRAAVDQLRQGPSANVTVIGQQVNTADPTTDVLPREDIP